MSRTKHFTIILVIITLILTGLITVVPSITQATEGVWYHTTLYQASVQVQMVYPPSSSIGTIYNTAEDLCQAESEITVVYRWLDGQQAFEGHVCGLPLFNFDLEKGRGYVISAPVTNEIGEIDFYLSGNQEDGVEINIVNVQDSDFSYQHEFALAPSWDGKKAEHLCQVDSNISVVYKFEVDSATGQVYSIGHVCGIPLFNYDLVFGQAYTLSVGGNVVLSGFDQLIYDYNNDGILNKKDVKILLKVVRGYLECPEGKICDVDADIDDGGKEADSDDLRALIRLIKKRK